MPQINKEMDSTEFATVHNKLLELHGKYFDELTEFQQVFVKQAYARSLEEGELFTLSQIKKIREIYEDATAGE